MIEIFEKRLEKKLKRNCDNVILYIGKNDAFRNTANELLDKIMVLKKFNNKNKNC